MFFSKIRTQVVNCLISAFFSTACVHYRWPFQSKTLLDTLCRVENPSLMIFHVSRRTWAQNKEMFQLSRVHHFKCPSPHIMSHLLCAPFICLYKYLTNLKTVWCELFMKYVNSFKVGTARSCIRYNFCSTTTRFRSSLITMSWNSISFTPIFIGKCRFKFLGARYYHISASILVLCRWRGNSGKVSSANYSQLNQTTSISARYYWKAFGKNHHHFIWSNYINPRNKHSIPAVLFFALQILQRPNLTPPKSM